MTAPAVPYTEPVCPKCSGAMWNQKAGKFPYKPGTPIFKCKDKECAANGGVIWEPKGAAAPAKAPPKPAQPYSSKPNDQLPPLLQNAAEEDAAELQSKIGFDRRTIEKDLSLYHSILEWYLDTIVPIVTRADIGASPESVNAAVATIFIQAKKSA